MFFNPRKGRIFNKMRNIKLRGGRKASLTEIKTKADPEKVGIGSIEAISFTIPRLRDLHGPSEDAERVRNGDSAGAVHIGGAEIDV